MAARIPLAMATRYDFCRSLSDDAAPWTVQAVNSNGLRVADYPLDCDLEAALAALVGCGWQVSRWAKFFHIRAWRGDNLPITRFDFTRQADRRWRVRRWLAGWTASTEPTRDDLEPHWNIATALAWFAARAPQEHLDMDGWRVQSVGASFYRAWLGPIMPVRTAGQIVRMRDAVRDWRNGVRLYAKSEPWRVTPRPAWLPEDVDVDQIEQNKLDLAYLL